MCIPNHYTSYDTSRPTQGLNTAAPGVLSSPELNLNTRHVAPKHRQEREGNIVKTGPWKTYTPGGKREMNNFDVGDHVVPPRSRAAAAYGVFVMSEQSGVCRRYLVSK